MPGPPCKQLAPQCELILFRRGRDLVKEGFNRKRRVCMSDGPPPQRRHAGFQLVHRDGKIGDGVGYVAGAFDHRTVDFILSDIGLTPIRG